MTISVLVVEDDAVIAWGIENRLKVLKYSVCGLALSGDEAVEKAIELRPDIVLMDINLGRGIDGIESAQLIRDQTKIPVIYLTAHSDDATIQRAKLTEPFGFILKPYEDSDLRTAIEIGLHKSKMEQELRTKKQWLAATLSSIGDGVIAVDTQGCVSFMNSLAEELTGWSLEDALGKEVTSIFQIVEESTRKNVRNPILESLEKNTKVGIAKNTILINRDGSERYIDDSANPIQNDETGMNGAVLVFRDITEERLQKERLKQTQSLDAISRMASGIAHDFNNIMTSIINYAEILRNVEMPETQRLTAVEQIRASGNRAASLTQQIVAFSRKQMLIPRVLNLNAHLSGMKERLQTILGNKIALDIESTNDVSCQVKVDPKQLEQVIENLVTNARDAMPGGGRLVANITVKELSESDALLYPDLRSGRYANVTFTDSGTGINESVLAHIFEPFFTTKVTGRGVGLGLSAAYGIIKQSGGHIEATSKIGVGTTISLFLPQFDEPIDQPKHVQTPAAVDRHTILLVDDEESLRISTKLLLEALGHFVLDASDGGKALEIFAKHEGPIHVLLTDLNMPKMSGRELAERLTAIAPGMKVIYMSGFTDDEIVKKNVETETHHFLQKPFSLASLKISIENALERS